MPADPRDVLDVLRYELNFLEQGGYERVRRLGLPASIFQDSLTCLNHGDPLRPHACRECLLYDFVPTECRNEDIPCHFIPLDPQGHTVSEIADTGEKLAKLRTWLRSTLERIQSERDEVA